MVIALQPTENISFLQHSIDLEYRPVGDDHGRQIEEKCYGGVRETAQYSSLWDDRAIPGGVRVQRNENKYR